MSISYKVLMLGPGDGGKSTFLKNMKLLRPAAEEPDYMVNQKKTRVQSSFINYCSELILAVELQNGGFSNAEVQTGANRFFPRINGVVSKPNEFSQELTDFLQNVWQSDEAKEVWKNRAAFQSPTNLNYFFENLERIAADDYVPSVEDWLKTKVMTTGITEENFTVDDGLNIRLVDVGGQRSERRKWIHSFDNVDFIIFFVAANEFDQSLYEDNTVNRWTETLTLFANICSNHSLRDIPIIVCLNKIDDLKQKLSEEEAKGTNLDTFFPELCLGTDYEGAFESILSFYETTINEQDENNKTIGIFFTNLIDEAEFPNLWASMIAKMRENYRVPVV